MKLQWNCLECGAIWQDDRDMTDIHWMDYYCPKCNSIIDYDREENFRAVES